MRRSVPGLPVAMRWARLDLPLGTRAAAAVSYFAAVTALLLGPSTSFEGVGGLFVGEDKVVHALVFLALALLVRWSLPVACGRGWRRAAGLGAVMAYGVSIEWLQPLLTHGDRQFEWLDLASNLAGIGAGWLIFGAATADGAAAAGPAQRPRRA
jgi:hypothetical protein